MKVTVRTLVAAAALMLSASAARADEPGSGRVIRRAHFNRVAALAARFARQRGAGRGDDVLPAAVRRLSARRRAAPTASVWISGQRQGFAGRFDPKTGKLEKIPLGEGAAPHGVIVGPDGDAWLTEGGQNAIARVDARTKAVTLFPLPKDFARANLNTLVFDKNGIALVHRAERRAWPRRSGDRQGRCLGVAEGPRALRHHHDARGRDLVRLARRRPHRARRYWRPARRPWSTRRARASARAASGRTPRACSG